MATETDVFAQINSLFPDPELVASPVEIALVAETLGKRDFAKVLLEETNPKSLSVKSYRLAKKLEQEDPDFHPYGISTLTTYDNQQFNALPLFWLRNQNIDIDSCWWNIFTETRAGYNNVSTPYNDEFWRRDLRDPDINRIPGEDHILLSERLGKIDPREALPYEAVYPEWFTAHPEYVKTDKILQQLGIDIPTLLDNYRESGSDKDIDHIMLGYFLPLLPLTDGMAEYTFKYFKEILKDKVFAAPLTKKTSPCVQYALDKDGLYTETGNLNSFLNLEGTTLSELKDNNYYYEYEFGARQAFTRFTDPRRQMSLEFNVDNIIVRKVKGRLPKSWHNTIHVTVGKGAPIPEFTAYADVLYPTDPNQTSFPFTAQELEDYDNNVSEQYQKGFASSGFLNIDPVAYISFRRQKVFIDGYSPSEDWDLETTTDLNAATTKEYYEEIIIVNPRVEYRGIYGADHKSKVAWNLFHDGSEETDFEVYWSTLDKNNIFRFDLGNNRYTKKTVGTRFIGEFIDSDALVIPVLYPVVSKLRLKDREEVVSRSLSILSLAIVRRKVSKLKKLVGILIVIFVIVFIFIPQTIAVLEGLTAAAANGTLLTYVATVYVQTQIIGFVSDEFINLLVNELGIEAAGYIVFAITAFVGFKQLGNSQYLEGIEFLPTMLKLTSNIEDSYQREISEGLKDIQKKQDLFNQEYEESLDALEAIQKELLPDPNLALTREIYMYNFTTETPSEFFNRTVGTKNPGIGEPSFAKEHVARMLRLSHKEQPAIVTEELSDKDYFKLLI